MVDGGLDQRELGVAILHAANAAEIGVAVTRFDAAGSTNVYVNDAATVLLGRSREELLTRSALESVAPEELPRITELANARRAGRSIAPIFETVIVRGDGGRVPIQCSMAHIDGTPPMTVSFLVDISKRRELEDARAASDARFRTVIEGAPDAVVVSRNGVILYANPAVTPLLGYSAEELVGKSMALFLDPAEISAMRERIDEAGRTGAQLPPREYSARRRDGTSVTGEVTSLPIEWDGRPAVLALVRDVSERKRAAEQLARADRLAAVGTLAAGVAHEINNPIGVMVLRLESLRTLVANATSGESKEEATRIIEDVQASADRVAAIVRDLRAFGRGGEGAKSVGSADLSSVLAACHRLVAHQVRLQATLVVDAPELPPVCGDAHQLEQVFVGLLLNAAHALAGVPSPRIEVRARLEGMDSVVVDVGDNGPGVPIEIRDRVFDPFFTTKPAGVGTGLGLAICHRIVTQLGGSIALASEPGAGTTFRVTLPVAAVAEAAARTSEAARAPAPLAAPPPVTDDGTARLRIMIVDDEVTLARSLVALLSRSHDVTAVASGEEAVARLCSGEEVDAVLCDLMMPGVTGMDVHARVSACRPALQDRFVFMTGGAFTDAAAAFLASVGSPCLEKPFTMRQLSAILRGMSGRPDEPT